MKAEAASKECQQPPKAGRSEDSFSSGVFQANAALMTLSFQTAGLQNCERIDLCWLSCLVCSDLLQQP